MQFRAQIQHGQIYWGSLDASMAFRKWSEANEGVDLVISSGTVAPAEKPRTDQQNKAMHKYFELVADALNDAGYPIQRVLKEHTKVEIDWTKDSVKEILWRTVQKRLLGKSSTTELSKQADIDKVYETVNRFLAQMGIHVPFPSHPPGFWDTAPMRNEP